MSILLLVHWFLAQLADSALQLVSVVTETIKCPSPMELSVMVEGATACALPKVAAATATAQLQL